MSKDKDSDNAEPVKYSNEPKTPDTPKEDPRKFTEPQDIKSGEDFWWKLRNRQ
jgi:hypothetical protein